MASKNPSISMPRATSDALLHDVTIGNATRVTTWYWRGARGIVSGGAAPRGRTFTRFIYSRAMKVEMLLNDTDSPLVRIGTPRVVQNPEKPNSDQSFQFFVNDRFSIFWNFEFY